MIASQLAPAAPAASDSPTDQVYSGGVATEAPFAVRCGACGRVLEWPGPSRHGHRPRCPQCRRRLRLPPAQRIVCPTCSQAMARRLPADTPRTTCRSCGATYTVPPPIASAASRRSRRSRGHHRRDALGAMTTTVLVLGFVLLCMLGWFF